MFWNKVHILASSQPAEGMSETSAGTVWGEALLQIRCIQAVREALSACLMTTG